MRGLEDPRSTGAPLVRCSGATARWRFKSGRQHLSSSLPINSPLQTLRMTLHAVVSLLVRRRQPSRLTLLQMDLLSNSIGVRLAFDLLMKAGRVVQRVSIRGRQHGYDQFDRRSRPRICYRYSPAAVSSEVPLMAAQSGMGTPDAAITTDQT